MKNILIAGAGSEIANAFVDNYYKQYNIYGISRQSKPKKYEDHYHINQYTIQHCNEAIEWYKSKNIDLDILLISNGFGKSGKIGEIELEKIQSMANTNLLVPYYFLHLKYYLLNLLNHEFTY